MDQKSSRKAVGKDVGVTGRGQGSGMWLALNSARSEAVAAGLFEAGQGRDYLVGRACPETRLCGQDTETSLVPWKKGREANREWPYRT